MVLLGCWNLPLQIQTDHRYLSERIAGLFHPLPVHVQEVVLLTCCLFPDLKHLLFSCKLTTPFLKDNPQLNHASTTGEEFNGAKLGIGCSTKRVTALYYVISVHGALDGARENAPVGVEAREKHSSNGANLNLGAALNQLYGDGVEGNRSDSIQCLLGTTR